MLGFRSFCLDLGHFDWIWATWVSIGPEGDEDLRMVQAAGAVGRMVGQTDGQIPLCSTGLRPPPGRCPAPPQLKSHTSQAGHGYR